jgi:hypothetical protein
VVTVWYAALCACRGVHAISPLAVLFPQFEFLGLTLLIQGEPAN